MPTPIEKYFSTISSKEGKWIDAITEIQKGQKVLVRHKKKWNSSEQKDFLKVLKKHKKGKFTFPIAVEVLNAVPGRSLSSMYSGWIDNGGAEVKP